MPCDNTACCAGPCAKMRDLCRDPFTDPQPGDVFLVPNGCRPHDRSRDTEVTVKLPPATTIPRSSTGHLLPRNLVHHIPRFRNTSPTRATAFSTPPPLSTDVPARLSRKAPPP